MNTAPKYSKVELIIRNKSGYGDGLTPKNSSNYDKDFPSTTRLEFFDAGLIITGDYIIVIEDERNAEHSLTSTGRIFQLAEVVAYKTHTS